MASRLRALRVVHPFPSILNTALVVAVAVVAGAQPTTTIVLGVGMLGIQFCIGAVNDLSDQALDARSKPWKPIPSGLISVRTTRWIAALSAAAALIAAASQGVVVLVLSGAMLGCGLLYDVRLKPTRWAWACFSVAFALLPVYAWYGAASVVPPLAKFLLPLAALAGPALQLSNGLVDLERDEQGGIKTLATRLGRQRSLIVIAVLLAVIHGLAWLTLAVLVGSVVPIVAAASALAVIGYALQTRRSVTVREAGWSAQAGAIALLAIGWLSAVA